MRLNEQTAGQAKGGPSWPETVPPSSEQLPHQFHMRQSIAECAKINFRNRIAQRVSLGCVIVKQKLLRRNEFSGVGCASTMSLQGKHRPRERDAL